MSKVCRFVFQSNTIFTIKCLHFVCWCLCLVCMPQWWLNMIPFSVSTSHFDFFKNIFFYQAQTREWGPPLAWVEIFKVIHSPLPTQVPQLLCVLTHKVVQVLCMLEVQVSQVVREITDYKQRCRDAFNSNFFIILPSLTRWNADCCWDLRDSTSSGWTKSLEAGRGDKYLFTPLFTPCSPHLHPVRFCVSGHYI